MFYVDDAALKTYDGAVLDGIFSRARVYLAHKSLLII